MNPILETALEVQRFCRSRRWRFCFIGAIAVQRWGEPRLTQDVDLTVLSGRAGGFLGTGQTVPTRNDSRQRLGMTKAPEASRPPGPFAFRAQPAANGDGPRTGRGSRSSSGLRG